MLSVRQQRRGVVMGYSEDAENPPPPRVPDPLVVAPVLGLQGPAGSAAPKIIFLFVTSGPLIDRGYKYDSSLSKTGSFATWIQALFCSNPLPTRARPCLPGQNILGFRAYWFPRLYDVDSIRHLPPPFLGWGEPPDGMVGMVH